MRLGFKPERALAGLALTTGARTPAGQKVFGGFKDLTTKFLNYAKGKSTLSRQEIMDFARRPELKKGEADLLLKKLEEFEGGKKVYHGTSAKEFDEFSGISYFTDDPKEALGFAKGVHLGGGKGGIPRVVESNLPMQKIKNIDDVVSEALDDGNIDEVIAKELKIAQKEGYDTLSFTHPSNYKDGEFTAYVPVKNPKVASSKLPAQEFADSIRRDLLELKPELGRLPVEAFGTIPFLLPTLAGRRENQPAETRPRLPPQTRQP